MKRAICLFMAFLMMALSLSLGIGAFVASAAEAEDTFEGSFPFDSVDFSCRLDVDTSNIQVAGIIRHDVFVTHNDYTIHIYAIPPGADAESVIHDPSSASVASAAIAIKFEFVLDAKDVLARYSRYCVVLRAPDGTQILCSEPKFAEVPSDFSIETGTRFAYKGISTTQVPAAARLGAGRVIIPVYFDRLITNTSNGYVYDMGGENLYFEKNCMEDLDVKVRSAAVSGSEVYLQYFLSCDSPFSIPNTYDTDVLRRMEAVTSFLCERYDSFSQGTLKGIVVGTEVDRAIASDAEEAAVLACSEKYALYVISVANTARRLIPSMDIVLPFSSRNTYQTEATDIHSPSFMLECVLSIFDRGFSNGLVCTAMIESDTVPLSYPDGWETGENHLSGIASDHTLHAGNVEIYAQYLNRLRERFSSTPKSFMFLWQASDSLVGNSLSTAYVYSYFRLIAEQQIASFIVSFTDCEKTGNMRGFSDISNLFTYIDTKESASVTQNLLPYFDVDSWASIACAPYNGSYDWRTLYRTAPSFDVPSNVKGSFSYFDFSTSANLNTWFAGEACKAVRLNYPATGGKALQMENAAMEREYAEAFCLYEYPENLIYTPYVAFRVAIEEKGTVTDSLYEIAIASGTDRITIVSTASLQAGKTETIVLDLSEYVTDYMSDYWRISIRPLSGESKEYSLWIYDIVGYSTEYGDAALAEKIEEERLRIRNLENADDGHDGKNETVWMIVGIVGVVLMIGIGVFILLRLNDDGEREEDNEKDNES